MEKLVLIENIFPSAEGQFKLVESGDGKKLYLEGIAIQGDVQNQNGRIYPREEIERAVNSMMKRIQKTGPIMGECDHPEGLNINLDRGTHLIHEMKMVGNDGHARIEIIPVGLGEQLYTFVKHGYRPGVSSRGSGNVDSSGKVSDFDIITIDIVNNPSAPDAYPSPIFEGYNKAFHDHETVKLVESIRRDPKAQKFLQKEVLRIIKNLDPRKV